jgi:hypothetical protein
LQFVWVCHSLLLSFSGSHFVCVAIDPVNAGELLIQILASMITYWNNCVITDNANSGAVSNGEDSGDTHMDVSGGHGDESHSSSTRHSGESGR